MPNNAPIEPPIPPNHTKDAATMSKSDAPTTPTPAGHYGHTPRRRRSTRYGHSGRPQQHDTKLIPTCPATQTGPAAPKSPMADLPAQPAATRAAKTAIVGDKPQLCEMDAHMPEKPQREPRPARHAPAGRPTHASTQSAHNRTMPGCSLRWRGHVPARMFFIGHVAPVESGWTSPQPPPSGGLPDLRQVCVRRRQHHAGRQAWRRVVVVGAPPAYGDGRYGRHGRQVAGGERPGDRHQRPRRDPDGRTGRPCREAVAASGDAGGDDGTMSEYGLVRGAPENSGNAARTAARTVDGTTPTV